MNTLTSRLYDHIKNFFNQKFIYIYLTFYAVALNMATLAQYFGFNYYILDYGLENQVLFNTSNGNWFESSYEVTNYLGDHFSPIILFFIGFYKLIPFYFLPVILQNFCWIASLIGLYIIAQKVIKNQIISNLLIFIFSINPLALSFIFFHYHPIVLCLPFLIFGLYYLFHTDRYYLGLFLLGIIAITGKEDVGFTIGFIGLYKFFLDKKLTTFLFSIYGFVYSIVAVKVFIPYFRNQAQDSLGFYSYIIDNYTLFRQNKISLKEFLKPILFHESKIDYIQKLFLPFGLFPLFTRKIFLLIPSFFVIYLTFPNSPMLTGSFQYDVITSGIIMYITIIGFQNLLDLTNELYISQRLTRILDKSNLSSSIVKTRFKILFGISTLLVIFVTSGILFTKLNKIYFNLVDAKSFNYTILPELDRIKTIIGNDKMIVVDNNTGGYTSEFRNSNCFPGQCGQLVPFDVSKVDYVILLKKQEVAYSFYNDFIKDNIDKFNKTEGTKHFTIYRSKLITKY